MPLLARTRSFLRNLFSSSRMDGDLDQEIHSHLEMLTEENIRAGMSPREAERANDLASANIRIRELISLSPGDYVVFDQRTHNTIPPAPSNGRTDSRRE